jgi:leucyl-tRNA synthetase
MAKYNPSTIEKKWQKYWQTKKIFHSSDTSKKPKKYILAEFPYPSGEGLHIGHLRPYLAADVVSRYGRARGEEVMFPFGFDAFGLPAENYAIKHGIQPEVATLKNIKNAKKQVLSWGISFDWSREINTTDPKYYKWTQWLFLQFFKAGLAYQAEGLINWCPKDKTGLANEEVINGRCERCGTLVEKKKLRQWFLKITAYAEKLLQGLKNLPEWPEAVKQQQANWIGKSEGAEISFALNIKGEPAIKIFSTKPETIFGATYLVLAPENQLPQILKNQISNFEEAQKYIKEAESKSDIERSAEQKEKTGLELKGIKAINPATKEEIPIWVADYVLAAYGTGAIMAVPAHDQRDLVFAEKNKLALKQVIDSDNKLINSAGFNGLNAEDAKWKITEFIHGEKKTYYKLRDWLFSRQRYWGEPIPLIHCQNCGIVAVPEKDLPVLLPKVKKYQPTGTGESPLAGIESWVKVKCPKCGGAARRESNTMPQWAGSSWYFLRYADPKNNKEFAAKEKLLHWLPVDIYFGGMEHTTLHLLYSRFWNLFLYDQGLVPVAEAYSRRQPHGIILGEDGEKMSKSRGNVANPDEVVKNYGADTLRLYELFLGPHEQVVSWNEQGLVGVRRFLERSWNFVLKNIAEAATKDTENSAQADFEINKLIKKVTADIEGIKFNTAIPALMEFLNQVHQQKVSKKLLENFLLVLAPFAPHIAEELWQLLGHKQSIVQAAWPQYDPAKAQPEKLQFVIQVNGRFRANIEMSKDTAQNVVETEAKKIATVKNAIASAKIKKIIFVQNRLINFVLDN